MATPTCRRIMIDTDPFLGSSTGGWATKARWPASWVRRPQPVLSAEVTGYRLAFTGPVRTRIHVTADERYELYLDGELIDRGPDRGDLDHWSFASYDLAADGGRHWLAARVWSLGDDAPLAQFSRAPGLLLADEGDQLSTGVADWQVADLPGHRLRSKGVAWGCGAKLELDGRIFPWGWETGADRLTWESAAPAEPGFGAGYANDVPPSRLLLPTPLPAQQVQELAGGRIRHVSEHQGGDTRQLIIDPSDDLAAESQSWQQLLSGTPLRVPAHTGRRVIIDLDDYVCAHPRLHLTGGQDATVRVHWQESLIGPGDDKADRDQVDGKRFASVGADQDGVGDLFIAGGGDEVHSTLWWEAGRYVEIVVSTADQPLTIEALTFVENHYPYSDLGAFDASDRRLPAVRRLAFRTLQMCSHETTMDCPYYEQLQYAGDTRIQNLVAYVATGDDRLARQAMLAFDRSRGTDGLTRSRYPSRIRQTIPPFSLWWIAMVHDFALWRGDLGFVADLLPGVRAVLDAHRRTVDDHGLFHALDGWNFTDWVPSWSDGAPVDAHWGVSGVLNLQLSHVAGLAADLETWAGSGALADHHRDLADAVRAAAEDHFWSAERGLYADDLDRTTFSEHAQCLALFAGAANGPDAVARTIDSTDPELARTTVYFDHYLFDAYGRIGRPDAVIDRMGLWFELLDRGLRTVVEQPEPTRSDCHAWGAHPIVHTATTLLGVRPVEPGMRRVSIRPQLGPLDWAETTIPTPLGALSVHAETGAEPRIDLPDGMQLDARR